MNDVGLALAGLDGFRSLAAADLDALAASFVSRNYSRGDAVAAIVGRHPVVLAVVVRGDAEWKSDARPVFNLSDGASFGDLSTDHRFDETVAVTVRRDATIALLTRDAFITFAEQHPEAVMRVVRTFASTLRRIEQPGPWHRPRRVRARGIFGRLVQSIFGQQ